MLNNLLQRRQQLMQQTQQAENKFQKQLNQDEQNWINAGAAAGGLISDGIAKQHDGINDNGSVGITTPGASIGLSDFAKQYAGDYSDKDIISVGTDNISVTPNNSPITFSSYVKRILEGGY